MLTEPIRWFFQDDLIVDVNKMVGTVEVKARSA